MGQWSKNNRACTTLWSTLHLLQQLTTNFNDSGKLTMSDLTFYNPLSSAQQRRQESFVLADQLDNIFRKIRGATYEAGVERTEAIHIMVEKLVIKSAEVQDLAECIDTSYAFWGEI
jgi:hypothetical protein